MAEPLSMFQVVLTSSVVSGVVSAFVAIWTTQKKISIENITQERTKWREKVRAKALEVHTSIINRNEDDLKRLKVEFSVILNPSDCEDRKIIGCIKLPQKGKENECSDVFSQRVSFLLKHDWERSKLEASPLLCRIRLIHRLCSFFIIKADRERVHRADI